MAQTHERSGRLDIYGFPGIQMWVLAAWLGEHFMPCRQRLFHKTLNDRVPSLFLRFLSRGLELKQFSAFWR